MNEAVLCTLYEMASRNPGWLAKLQAVCHLSEEEVGFLEWLDDQEHKLNKKLTQLENEMYRDGVVPELIDCETDEERIQKLNRLIFTILDQDEVMRLMDKPYYERAIALLAKRYDHWVKLRNRIRARLMPKPERSGTLTDAEIERAREYPLEKLVETRSGYVLCPFHEDKTPSMWVKNGFGWCFSCNAWCDSIRYQMQTRSLKFADAVRSLVHA